MLNAHTVRIPNEAREILMPYPFICTWCVPTLEGSRRHLHLRGRRRVELAAALGRPFIEKVQRRIPRVESIGAHLKSPVGDSLANAESRRQIKNTPSRRCLRINIRSADRMRRKHPAEAGYTLVVAPSEQATTYHAVE